MIGTDCLSQRGQLLRLCSILVVAGLIATGCSLSDDTITPISSVSKTPNNEIDSSLTKDSPDVEFQLTDIPCADNHECGSGFRHNSVDYFITCGQIDFRRHDITDSTRASGRVKWNEEPIEVREIIDWPSAEFVAVRFDGDNCQDNPGKHWYIASAGNTMDRVAFCDLVGGVMTTDNECDEM